MRPSTPTGINAARLLALVAAGDDLNAGVLAIVDAGLDARDGVIDATALGRLARLVAAYEAIRWPVTVARRAVAPAQETACQ